MKFKTFDGKFTGMIGQNGTFEYEQTQRIYNGNQYTDNTLITPKQPTYQQSMPMQPAQPNPAIVEINGKLDTIISMLQALGTATAGNMPDVPMDNSTEELDVSQIPF